MSERIEYDTLEAIAADDTLHNDDLVKDPDRPDWSITVGELRQGVERIRHRGDDAQAKRLEGWLDRVTTDYADALIPFDEETAHIWGRLRAPHPENPLDKQIAATALLHDLIVVTRNTAHYEPTAVRLFNPFT